MRARPQDATKQSGPSGVLRVKQAQTPEDLAAVQAFRYRVYIEELAKPMGEADHDRRIVVDPADQSGLVFAAFDDDELVGTLRLNVGLEAVIGDPHLMIYHLGEFSDCSHEQIAFAARFMLRPDYRGSLAAHRLAIAALEAAIDRGVRLCFCYCAPYLVSYYEQMGFRRYTNNFEDPLGYRIPMLLVVYDHSHLRAVHSPFADRVPPAPAGEEWGDYFASRFPDFVLPVNSRLVSTEEFYQLLNYKLHDDPLASIPLLRGLAKHEADQVFKTGTVISCQPGDTLIRAHEHSSEIYLVLSALVGVQLPQSNRVIRILGPGELLGEMAFLLGSTRTANVVVLRAGELVVLSESTLQHLIAHAPVVASKLLHNLARILCERLATTTRSLSEVISPGGPGASHWDRVTNEGAQPPGESGPLAASHPATRLS